MSVGVCVFVCVFIALVIQHTVRKWRYYIAICGISGSTIFFHST